MLCSVLGVSKLRVSSALTSCFCERGARGSGSYAPRFAQLWSSVLVPVVLKISAIERNPLTILSYWSTGFECAAPCSCWEPACRWYQLPSPRGSRAGRLQYLVTASPDVAHGWCSSASLTGAGSTPEQISGYVKAMQVRGETRFTA